MSEAWEAVLSSLLSALKIDLLITTESFDSRLTQYLRYAYEAIGDTGITLAVTNERDKQLVIMYAAWMWRRRDSGEAMPRMIQYALHNRLFSQKMADESESE